MLSIFRSRIADFGLRIEKTSTKTSCVWGSVSGIIVTKLPDSQKLGQIRNRKSVIRNGETHAGSQPMKTMKRIKPSGCELHRWLTRSGVAGIAGLMVLLSACVVGPNYSRPPVQTPPAYKEQTASTDKEIETWKKAQPSDEIARGKWWEVFHDPSLNGLEDRVNISNQNLKTAEAQFREARALVKLNRASYYPTVSAGTNVTVSHPSVNHSFRPSTNAPTFADYLLSGDLSYEADL
jgi:hypothetical protein